MGEMPHPRGRPVRTVATVPPKGGDVVLEAPGWVNIGQPR
jgi:hypothetical protein